MDADGNSNCEYGYACANRNRKTRETNQRPQPADRREADGREATDQTSMFNSTMPINLTIIHK